MGFELEAGDAALWIAQDVKRKERKMMPHETRITFVISTTDSGDRTYQVESRYGFGGDNPPTNVLHDSHFLEMAKARLYKAVENAAAGRFDAITVAHREAVGGARNV